MSKCQVAVVFGSLRRESLNRKLADALVKLGPAEFSFQHVHIGDLRSTTKTTTPTKPSRSSA